MTAILQHASLEAAHETGGSSYAAARWWLPERVSSARIRTRSKYPFKVQGRVHVPQYTGSAAGASRAAGLARTYTEEHVY